MPPMVLHVALHQWAIKVEMELIICQFHSASDRELLCSGPTHRWFAMGSEVIVKTRLDREKEEELIWWPSGRTCYFDMVSCLSKPAGSPLSPLGSLSHEIMCWMVGRGIYNCLSENEINLLPCLHMDLLFPSFDVVIRVWIICCLFHLCLGFLFFQILLVKTLVIKTVQVNVGSYSCVYSHLLNLHNICILFLLISSSC